MSHQSFIHCFSPSVVIFEVENRKVGLKLMKLSFSTNKMLFLSAEGDFEIFDQNDSFMTSSVKILKS